MTNNQFNSLLINQYKTQISKTSTQSIWSTNAWTEDKNALDEQKSILKSLSSKIGFKKCKPCYIGLGIGLLIAAIPFAVVSTIWIDTLLKSTSMETTITTTTVTTITSTTTTTTTTTTTPFPAIATSTLSEYCGCEGFTLSLTSISFSTINATYEWQSSPINQNIWTSVNGTRTTSTLMIPNQMNSMNYRCIIYVANPSPMTLTSAIVTVLTTTNTTYCPPRVVSCSSGDGIENFTLLGESNTGVNDTATGCSTKGYRNQTLQSVSLYQNTNYTAQVSSKYPSSQTLAVWIDFNNDFNFELWERVAYKLLNSLSLTDVVVSIPSSSSGAATGTHRMRATVIYSSIPNSCATVGTFGETHDYTVNILAATG